MELKERKIYDYINNNKLEIEQLVNDYTKYIYAMINKMSVVFTKEDIEEIISDVFFIVWNNQDKLNINNNMSAYIRGVTKNLIKQKYRHIRINDNITDFEEKLISLSDLERDFYESEENKSILNELKKLKLEDKHIFIQYYYYSKSIKEICILYNMSEAKVKSKLFRTRKKIKKTLKERGGRF